MTDYWKSAETPETSCPGCGRLLDRVIMMDGKPPNPGDVSVCANCAEINVFGPDLTVHAATLKELAEIPLDVHRAVDRMRDVVKRSTQRILAVNVPRSVCNVDHECDRCGRPMKVFPEVDLHGAIRIDTCVPCRFAALQEFTPPAKRGGDPITWPAHWHRAKVEAAKKPRKDGTR